MTEPMNLLLVTVDSLRADRVTERVMPYTHSVAGSSLRYTQAIANGPSTPASFPAIHASRHFASIEGIGLPEKTDGTRTLAEQLTSAGFDTAGFTDNHFASGSYHFDRGFAHMHDASGTTEAGRIKQFVQSNLDKEGALFRTIERLYTRADSLLGRFRGFESEYERAASLNERLLSWVEGRDRWFAWLHYMDVHHPYEPPEAYQRQFLDTVVEPPRARALARKGTHHPDDVNSREWELIEGLYDAECAYVDDQFETLVSRLEDLGVRDETAIVFTADHGELVGEHGHAGHPPEFWEGIVRVPLFIAVPGKTSETVDSQVELLDLPPTISELLDVAPADQWEGHSMLPLLSGEQEERREVVFGDVGRQIDYRRCFARRADGWKLLQHAADGEFLFNVADQPDEDPAMERSAAEPERYRELRDALDEHRERMASMRSGGAGGVSESDEMVEDHLRELGYLE